MRNTILSIMNQQPAAFKKLSYGRDAGSWKKAAWCWYAVAQSLGPVSGNVLGGVDPTFESKNGFPLCNSNGKGISCLL